MEFIKKNYEKIILGAVLLGLVGVLAFMPVMIFYDQQRMKDLRTTVIPQHVEPLPALDLSREQAVLKRLKSPGALDFSTTNRLFNPVLWVKSKDGVIMKAEGLGPSKAVVTKITPLYFSIALDSVMTGSSGNRYVLVVTNEAAVLPAMRHPQRKFISEKETLKGFCRLDKVVGPTNAPTELDLVLTDPDHVGQLAQVTPDKPFQRVDSYLADVKYDPENLRASGLRVGDHLNFAGEDYNIIDIQSNAVVLSAQSNQKKYTLPYAP